MFSFFKKEKPQKADWLVLGLGNPGKQYEATRHNIGWMVAACLAEQHNIALKPVKSISYCGNFLVNSQTVVLGIPTTFMNNSGEAAQKLSELYQVSPENIIVITDEYNFPVGKIHLRRGGSSGGHNGVQSIIDELGTENFLRLRCGIGKNFPQGGMVNYVLSPFSEETLEARDAMIIKAADAVSYTITNDLKKAMSDINKD